MARTLVALVIGSLISGAAAQSDKIRFNFADEVESAGGPSVLITGRVFEDIDGDGQYTPGKDILAPAVGVSDGASVTVSDDQGRYVLPSTEEAELVFVTQPAGYAKRGDFFALLPEMGDGTQQPARAADGTPLPQRFGVDFPLTRAAKPEPDAIRFIQVADPLIRGPQDRKAVADAMAELERLTPGIDFVVATGQIADPKTPATGWDVYASQVRKSRLPWLHAAGGWSDAVSSTSLVSPPWYSVDVGPLHLLVLGDALDEAESRRRDAWIERDVKLLSGGRQVLAFLASLPNPGTLERLRRLGVKVMFHGGTYACSMHGFKDGTAVVGQSPWLVGGVDASPAAFRIVSVQGEQMQSEFRVRGVSGLLKFPYPQGDLSAQPRVLANVYDTIGDISEARFRLAVAAGPVGEGTMTRVGPFTWMGSLDPKDYGVKELPADFVVAVRARSGGDQFWENGGRVVVPQRKSDRPAKVKAGTDWPQFMGSSHRTGEAADVVRPPFRMVWATPTHGSIDLSSPVYYRGRVAIGVKDRDNLINNGLALLSAETGELAHFRKSDAMINGTPAFTADPEQGPGQVFAVSGTGTVYLQHGESGANQGESRWAEDGLPWVCASPMVDEGLTVTGGPGRMMGLDAVFATQRWINTFGKGGVASFTSPSAVGPLVVMGGAGVKMQERDASLYALDRGSGQVRWVNNCVGIGGSVAVRDDKGFALDGQGRLKVIDLKTGKDLQVVDLGGAPTLSTPAIDHEVIVAPTGLGTVDAFDTGTLQRRWSFRGGESLWEMAPLGRSRTAVFSSPTISGDLIYIGCSDGHLYALDKKTGEVRWKYDFGVPTLSTPCVTGNALFTAACDGNVYGFTSVFTSTK